MAETVGRIIIGPGLNVWPHELKTVEALAAAGHAVAFLRKSDSPYVKTPDVIMDCQHWEFKAPTDDRLKAVERNLRRGLTQSINLVFDSRRFKRIPDTIIEHELHICASGRVKGLNHLLFANRKGAVIGIK